MTCHFCKYELSYAQGTLVHLALGSVAEVCMDCLERQDIFDCCDALYCNHSVRHQWQPGEFTVVYDDNGELRNDRFNSNLSYGEAIRQAKEGQNPFYTGRHFAVSVINWKLCLEGIITDSELLERAVS